MTKQERQRRWFRFSLRTLLVFVVLLSVPLGWFAMRLEKARRQREAVAMIVELGGDVAYDVTGPHWSLEWYANVEFVFFPGGGPPDQRPIIGDEEMKRLVPQLKALPKLKYLQLSETHITDARLADLTGLTNLEYLDLNGSPINDPGLKHLEALRNLKHLNVANTQVTGAALDGLNELDDLTSLVLDDTQLSDTELGYMRELTALEVFVADGMSDAGWRKLKGLTGLRWLFLNGTQISDADLKHLRALNQLEFLHIHSTQLTDEGLRQLQDALPNCHVEHWLQPPTAVARPYPPTSPATPHEG